MLKKQQNQEQPAKHSQNLKKKKKKNTDKTIIKYEAIHIQRQIEKKSENLTPLTEKELQQVSGGKNFGDFLKQWWWSIFREDSQ